MTTTRKSTLLDLVQAVSEYATSDDEVVATVAYLINSGKVLLCGNFGGEDRSIGSVWIQFLGGHGIKH